MRKLAAALALLFSMTLLTTPFLALAEFSSSGSGLEDTTKAAYGDQAWNEGALNVGVFVGKFIIRPVIGLTGLIFLVLTVYAGVMWMTSRGDTKQVEKAKGILIASVVGALIIASAYVITNFVIESLTGVSAVGP